MSQIEPRYALIHVDIFQKPATQRVLRGLDVRYVLVDNESVDIIGYLTSYEVAKKVVESLNREEK